MDVVLACAIFVVAYALIATERIHRVSAAIGGVAVMAFVGVTDTETAFGSPESGIDWNVIFLLFGMMLIVGVLELTGLFEFLAIWSQGDGLWWAFALGADLGGNTTAVAAGANVVILGIAAAKGSPISFWTFTKYGLVVTVATLVVAWPYVWLRYYA